MLGLDDSHHCILICSVSSKHEANAVMDLGLEGKRLNCYWFNKRIVLYSAVKGEQSELVQYPLLLFLSGK